MFLGTWSNHDSSFCILNNEGEILYHIELERWLREKEVKADSVKFALDFLLSKKIDTKYHATCFPLSKTTQYKNSWELLNKKIKKENQYVFGHHLSHCANAFYSSNYKEATIVSFDGGGIENSNNFGSACSIYHGKENKLYEVKTFGLNQINIGGLYGRCTRYIHQLPSGGKLGSSQGSVMSIASFGNPGRFYYDFKTMLSRDLVIASHKPPNQPQDLFDPSKEVKHPYLSAYKELIKKEGWETEVDLAAGLQSACEEQIFSIVQYALNNSGCEEYLCLSGGVALNCVAMGKLFNRFPKLKGIYIPPVCGDANLSIGSVQYLYHHILENKRNYLNKNSSPYLGKNYSQEEILDTVEKFNERIKKVYATDRDIISLLDKGKIVSVFNERAESGKRALGNRSILADPRKKEMKDIVNNKIKHRKWYRPSAPSVLREDVNEFFEKDVDSPYMSFALKVKKDKINKIPAVVHVDNTARLQTVIRSDNEWYYNFLKIWKEVSGVGVLLNTSLNDREPICDSIEDALNCFLKTELEYLYIPSLKMLIKK